MLVEGWARDGLSDEQISKNMGVAYSTFRVWLDKFSALSAALKKGKAPVDLQVENQLLKSALGYKVTVKEPIKVRTKKTQLGVGTIEEEHIEYADKEIYIPPVPVAQFFWLKNRRPDKWRDKPEPARNPEAPDDPLMDKLMEDLDEQSKVVE